MATRSDNRWVLWTPPAGSWDVAIRRTENLVDAALALHRTREQDFLNTLRVSAYLQGVADGDAASHREEKKQ